MWLCGVPAAFNTSSFCIMGGTSSIFSLTTSLHCSSPLHFTSLHLPFYSLHHHFSPPFIFRSFSSQQQARSAFLARNSRYMQQHTALTHKSNAWEREIIALLCLLKSFATFLFVTFLFLSPAAGSNAPRTPTMLQRRARPFSSVYSFLYKSQSANRMKQHTPTALSIFGMVINTLLLKRSPLPLHYFYPYPFLLFPSPRATRPNLINSSPLRFSLHLEVTNNSIGCLSRSPTCSQEFQN
uniref:Uncharacterized protein n=1 Tax=Trypanosoma congolense (strain IL3000) TaxID=1068625 RepID=G0UUH3_TRYCI|nr:hypothetical protein TCIL3000_9_4370 [Trypanosoma congolense IL3000]